MKIGIILHPYGEDKPSGLARTIFEWTKALLEADKENDYIIFLRDKPKEALKFPGNNWSIEILGGGIFWQDRLRKKSKADIYLFQTPRLPFFYTPSKSIIITQDYPYKYLKAGSAWMYLRYKLIGWYHKNSLKRAHKVIAVSQWAKEDTARFFGIPQKKITVIPMGYKRICSVTEKSIDIPDEFFLFVGVIKARKNFLNIVKAFKIFKENNPESKHKLVVGGKNSGNYFDKIKDFIIKQNLENEIIFLGFLNDHNLSFIYKRAEALVFPTIVESFGMPVLEAMDCGVPVITSDFGGPSEIGENGTALLVDPYSPSDIAGSMERIVKDDVLRKELIKKGKERSEKFSWANTAESTLKLINSV